MESSETISSNVTQEVVENLFLDPEWLHRLDTGAQELLVNIGKSGSDKIRRYLITVKDKVNQIRYLAPNRGTDEEIKAKIKDIALCVRGVGRVMDNNKYPLPLIERYNYLVSLIEIYFPKEVSRLNDKFTQGEHFHFPNEDISSKLKNEIFYIQNQITDLTRHSERNKESVLLQERRLAKVAEDISGYESNLSSLSGRINSDVDKIVADIREKQDQVNKLVESIGGTAVAGSYENSAAIEARMANITRGLSLILMTIVVVIIGVSFYETASPDFKWQIALSRLLFSITLSVPAAYLARESTKHRQQQYDYLRKSLDLKAIAPYLSSLPEVEQHKLKIEMANRIFGTKDSDSIKSDSYPVNIQELLMAIIARSDGVKNGKKDENEGAL